MKRKHLFLAIAALLAAGGLWLGLSAWRTPASRKSGTTANFTMRRGPNSDPRSAASSANASQTGPNNRRNPGRVPRPPDPTQRFRDFTPEQRVEFARKGHGPGG